MSWTHYANNQTPAAVATVYAATQFDEPREVETCHGGWHGGMWRGEFRLVDGVRRYLLYGRDGWWTVEPIAESYIRAEMLGEVTT